MSDDLEDAELLHSDGSDTARADETIVTIRTPSGQRIRLSMNEYRLALLGLVDFESHWEALETAATLVTDGAAKGQLIRERLRPVADHLPALLKRGVDSLELLAARFWFRQEMVK